MQNQIICQNCNQQYRDDNLPRLLIGCGHTYCENCILSFIYDEDDVFHIRCPEDQTEMEVKEKNLSQFPKNLALIKVIESKKDVISFKDNQINVSKITKNSEVHEQQDTTQLISMMNDAKNQSDYENSQKQSQRQRQRQNQNQSQKERQKQKLKQKSQKLRASPVAIKQKKQQMCPKHKKVLDIVCTVDLRKICASCAIFGEHRNHTFKSLQEVSQMQTQYCEQITSIINQKQKISRQISATQTKNDILSILTNKKNKLKTKITEQFEKLETKIANKKKETLKKLDQIAKKQENNLKNCMKFDDQLVKSYEDWYSKSSSQLKILEENDFQSKLLLLFEGKNIDGDIIEEGENLIQQMKISQQNILSEVEKKLQNLNITVNEEVYSSLDDFIRVYAESYKQISAIIIKNQFQPQNVPQIHSQYNSQTHSQYNSQNQPQNQVYPQIPILNINNYNSNRPQGGTERQKRKTPSPKYDNVINSSYLQVSQPIINHVLDESLLENDDQPPQPTVDEFNLRMSVSVNPTMNFNSVPLTQRFSVQPNIQAPVQKIEKQPEPKIKVVPKLNNSQNEIKNEKMNKKKLSKMKLPDRYQKIVEGLLADTLQILDLTNAEIGDSNISIICENIQNSKVRTLKLIRNKLTDEGVSKIIPFLGQVTTLNLSQNLLTENVLDILYENKKYLGCVRAIILSQNKIIERKHKIKIDKLKKLEWNVSV